MESSPCSMWSWASGSSFQASERSKLQRQRFIPSLPGASLPSIPFLLLFLLPPSAPFLSLHPPIPIPPSISPYTWSLECWVDQTDSAISSSSVVEPRPIDNWDATEPASHCAILDTFGHLRFWH
ncbi:hypothetical protein E2C01_059666 [Portunus trituberculatus]|uniref:Uncharacterized protein n=1 Tax=Portunus trituberculatus TaxID=210409 RepID=A0A5B7H909_PORTR|nr:hypothetical protein [Portunus trituberculatus]